MADSVLPPIDTAELSSPNPTFPDNGGFAWTAVAVKERFTFVMPAAGCPSKIFDTGEKTDSVRGVILQPGETGFCGPQSFVDGRWVVRVRFIRDEFQFLVTVPNEILRTGSHRRSTAEKVTSLQLPSIKSSYSRQSIKDWVDGSKYKLDKYVKRLWLSLRDNREKLDNLGLPSDISTAIFQADDQFIPILNSACESFLPSFRGFVEDNPSFTPHDLITQCQRQTPNWPPNGDNVVYARVYTHIDMTATDLRGYDMDNVAVYVGQSIWPQDRNAQHEQGIETRTIRTTRPTHYDLAARSPPSRRYVMVPISQGHLGFFNATPQALNVMEQTTMLLLRSYAPWLTDGDGTAGHMSAPGQQAHFLLTIDQTIRSELKFLEHWRPKFGTNCKSPVFEGQRMFLVSGRRIQDIYMERPTLGIQAVHTPSPHPPKPGMTTYKLAMFCSKFRAKNPNPAAQTYSFVFTGLRADIDDPTHFTRKSFGIYIPNELGQVIDSDTKTTKGFMAMLVFEVMDDQTPHERPFYRFPAIGPYEDTAGVNSLGLRVEWQKADTKQWYSSPFGLSHKYSQTVTSGLAKGDATRLNYLFHKLTALLQMLRSQHSTDPSAGFFKDIHIGLTRPIVQELHPDHMRQTVSWKTPIPTDVPPCREATKAENELKLRSLLEDMSSHTAIGAPDFGQTDMFFKYDSVSKKSSGLPGWKTDPWTCDTCQIRKKQSLVHRKVACNFDAAAGGCGTCTALVRPCTFTPLKPLLESWVGKPIDWEDYYVNPGEKNTTIFFPMTGRGPFAKLYPQADFHRDFLYTPIPTREPWNWRIAFATAQEEMEGEDGTVLELEDQDLEDPDV